MHQGALVIVNINSGQQCVNACIIASLQVAACAIAAVARRKVRPSPLLNVPSRPPCVLIMLEERECTNS